MIKFILFISPTFICAINAYSAELGSLLFNGNCATCHHLHKESSAPTIYEVRKRYINAFPQKKDFINNLSLWVYKPNKETTLMDDKIKKFGIMPHLGYDISTLKIIAEYIYQGDIESTTK